MLRFGVVVLFLLSLVPRQAPACTILTVVGDDGHMLVGNNEDFTDPFTAVRVLPATDTEHGRICFGLATGGDDFATLGGVNEHGLFIDGNGLTTTDWAPIEGRETYTGIVEAHVLAHCATVAEAVDWFRNTNVAILARAKFLLADRTGASAVVEWAQNALRVHPMEGRYKISTNFRETDHGTDQAPCYRYRTAEAMLRSADAYSLDLVRRILSVNHFEGSGSTTLFSYMCDLTTGKLHIYNFHNFEDVVVFDVAEELSRGYAHHALPMLFPHIPIAQHLDVPRKLSRMLQGLAERKTVEDLVSDLEEAKALGLATYGRDYTESIANSLGYGFLGDGRIDEAIEVFHFNVASHPESGNVYDSLGEAYLARGDTVQAIANYRESLARDPGNGNAVEVLGRIE